MWCVVRVSIETFESLKRYVRFESKIDVVPATDGRSRLQRSENAPEAVGATAPKIGETADPRTSNDPVYLDHGLQRN